MPVFFLISHLHFANLSRYSDIRLHNEVIINVPLVYSDYSPLLSTLPLQEPLPCFYSERHQMCGFCVLSSACALVLGTSQRQRREAADLSLDYGLGQLSSRGHTVSRAGAFTSRFS